MNPILAGVSYLRSNPLFALRATSNAARLRASVPLDVLRWAISKRPRGKGPERIELSGADPALRVELTVDLYGTKIDVAANILIESIDNGIDSFKVALRVRNLELHAPAGTPAAMMVGALDLSNPGNLLKMMPQKHADLLQAEGDRIVIDLLKIPKMARNKRLRRVLAALSFIGVREVRTENDVLVIGFSVRPSALPTGLARMGSV
jgi:hypothetical protein